MTNKIYKRKHLIGDLLTISDGESMTITGPMAAGKQALDRVIIREVILSP